MEKNKIDMPDKLNEKPIKEYKELVSLNAKSKELDLDNERIKVQINAIYKKWAFLKEFSIQYIGNNNIVNLNAHKNDCNRALTEDGFISSMKLSPKKIQFYKKYNKHIYLSLMILSIITGILIVLSEFTLILPVNISLFGLIFKNV